MSRLPKVALFLALICGQMQGADVDVHVFLLSGQSNMAAVKPEVHLAPEAKRLFPGAEVVFIKAAFGGMPIRHWVPEWHDFAQQAGINPASIPKEKKSIAPGAYFKVLMDKAKADGRFQTATSVTFCWMQGEADGMQGHGAAYKPALRLLIKRLREELQRPDLRVVIGRINDKIVDSKKRGPSWNAVRDAQVALARADKQAAWVDVDGFNNMPQPDGSTRDDMHYTKAGYAQFGIALMRQAYLLIMGKEPADDGKPQDPLP